MTEVHWLQDAHRVSDFLLHRRAPTAAELMVKARRKTGLHDFGPLSVEDPLDRLQDACRGEADLNLFGRASTHWDNLRLLTNLLILRDRETADPSILTRPVERPIFVMGLPRSGTSFLHAGALTWVTLRLLHAGVGLGGALVIDSLISGAKALAFLVPGALGVQEGALVLLGQLFGVPPAAALALSLARRGRDLFIARPVLGLWQARHGGRILGLARVDGSSERRRDRKDRASRAL